MYTDATEEGAGDTAYSEATGDAAYSEATGDTVAYSEATGDSKYTEANYDEKRRKSTQPRKSVMVEIDTVELEQLRAAARQAADGFHEVFADPDYDEDVSPILLWPLVLEPAELGAVGVLDVLPSL
jgi:hypothetical protein